MPYVSKVLLGRALEALRGQHPLLIFSLLAMTAAGVPTLSLIHISEPTRP